MNVTLYQGLVWPAVAGNVAWSFFALAIGPSDGKPAAPRLLTLCAISGYLFLDWRRVERLRELKKSAGEEYVVGRLYGLVEAILAAAISALAIGTYCAVPEAALFLVAVFLAGVVGHGTRAWGPDPDGGFVGSLNGLGLALACLGLIPLSESFGAWWRCGVIAFVALVWGLYRLRSTTGPGGEN